MIVNAKKAISGGSKMLTYFFTRNVPGTDGRMYRAPCAENDKINVIDERYFGTHILGNNLPFQTSGIPKKNTRPLISIRGLAFNGLLRSSEK